MYLTRQWYLTSDWNVQGGDCVMYENKAAPNYNMNISSLWGTRDIPDKIQRNIIIIITIPPTTNTDKTI